MKDFLTFAKCERFSYCLMLNMVIFLSYLQVCLEGQISRKSAIRSLSDGYQPSGDQIPWKFCEQFQDTVFPGLSGARIVRIATHPGVMRVSLFIKHGKLCWFFHILVSLYFYIIIFICVYLFAVWIWFTSCGTFSKVCNVWVPTCVIILEDVGREYEWCSFTLHV